jgi:hypothetical protein
LFKTSRIQRSALVKNYTPRKTPPANSAGGVFVALPKAEQVEVA